MSILQMQGLHAGPINPRGFETTKIENVQTLGIVHAGLY